MNEWLQQMWERSKSPYVRALLLCMIVFLVILGLASLISDTGFAKEIQEYRSLIWVGAALVALVIAVGWLYYHNHKQLATCRTLVGQLQGEIGSLRNEKGRLAQERESAFRLMKKYKAQTQEDIIAKLRQLALLSIMQEQWRQKRACVERLRIEQLTCAIDADIYVGIEGCIAVIINLGSEDNVMEHMRFIVQDPTDSHEYGVIEIQEVYPEGATCRILEITDMAFWNDAVQAASEERPSILEPFANIIVPASALKDIPPESAEQLLAWLQSIRRVEL